MILLGCQRPAPEPPSAAPPRNGTSAQSTSSPATDERPDPLEVVLGIRDDDWFETVTASTGVEFAYRNGDDAQRHTLLETLGGGAGWLDYDGDGDCDLFLTGGGTIPEASGSISGLPPALYQKRDGVEFRRVDLVAGLTECRHYSHGCAAADFNRDGFPDMAVAGFGGVLLYLNQGDGTFSEIAEPSELTAPGWCTALAWSDIDQDGLNDLFVVRYVDWTLEDNIVCTSARGAKKSCDPTTYPPTTSLLLHNRGDGTFEDESVRRGITAKGNGLGVVAADLNADGRCEFYVANDETQNHYYVPTENGGYQETAQLAGVATNEFGLAEGSMGIAVGDYDGDSRPDLFITNFEREDDSLYRNLGDGMFLHASQRAGLSGRSRTNVRFGTIFTDFDGDGWLDLIIASGHVYPGGGVAEYRQPPQLFRNLNGKRFEEVSARGGEYFRRRHTGRGLAVGDWNDDGAPDVVVSHQNDPAEILLNRRIPERYVRLHLRGLTSNSEAIGATVILLDGERSLTHSVSSGSGYFSQQDPRLLFALQSPAESVSVQVRWPSGRAEQFSNLAINRTHELLEGHGAADSESP